MPGDSGARLTTTIAVGLALLAAGCATSDGLSTTSNAQSLPAAVTLGQDLHMVPVARDGRGCVQYRVQSQSRPRIEAVFYRTRAGDFSTIEAEAACT